MNVADAWKSGVSLGKKQEPYAGLSLDDAVLSEWIPKCPASNLRMIAGDLCAILAERSALQASLGLERSYPSPSQVGDALLQIANGADGIASGFRTLARASSRPGQGRSEYGEHVMTMMEDLGATLFHYIFGHNRERSLFEEFPIFVEKLPRAFVMPNGQTRVNTGFIIGFDQLSKRSQTWYEGKIPDAEPYRHNDRDFVRKLGCIWHRATGRKPTIVKNEQHPSQFHRLYAFLVGYLAGSLISTHEFELAQAELSAQAFDHGDIASVAMSDKARFYHDEIKHLEKMRLTSATTLHTWLKEG